MPEEMKIKKDMLIGEAVQKFPETAKVMMKYGLHCIGCHVGAMETIEQGASAHGLEPADIQKMVDEMNEACKGDEPTPEKEKVDPDKDV